MICSHVFVQTTTFFIRF